MYTILMHVKVAREDFLEPHFTATFDALFRLVADPDPAVHQATTFLDALMKACAQYKCCIECCACQYCMQTFALCACCEPKAPAVWVRCLVLHPRHRRQAAVFDD